MNNAETPRSEEASMNPLAIPEIVIRRLPLYLRTLDILASQGQAVTSSQELGNRLGITSTQIRKDLSYFGEFGKQGTGYDIQHLQQQLRSILQVDQRWDVALVGAGDLGHALLNYTGFEERGFCIAAVFDKDKGRIGRKIGKLEIMDAGTLPQLIESRRIQVAIIAVPADEAQETADVLVRAGVKAILNYAPITLTLPEHVRVHTIDPIRGLQSMTYYLNPDQS
jgi:redox-sensing transcriptional repressor